MKKLLAASPLSIVLSADPDGDRHAEPGHPVEHVAADFCLDPLIGQSPGVELPSDDGLVAIHPRFDQAAARVAGTALPPYASMLRDVCNMAVPLCRDCFIPDRCHPWRNDGECFGMTFGNAIIRAVCCQRCNLAIDLIQQRRYRGDIPAVIGRQLRSDNLMCDRVNAKMQLAPSPVRSTASDPRFGAAAGETPGIADPPTAPVQVNRARVLTR